ncbi:MAG: FtsX-like permease family protein [Lentisphaeria bacterium]|nr:FtsX-like permease family protein [Lentisphaeria bacterium]
MSDSTKTHEIEALPFRKIVRITCKGIKIRIWRSLIVVSGIVLAIAFLSYILCADGFLQNAAANGTPELLKRLSRAGIEFDDMDNQRVQTYWMVGLALLISFVGIVNAMLMSVTERFREIGTMKCLGALDGFVLKMFLIESFIEGSAGAALGMVIGVALAYVEGVFQYGGAVWALLPFHWLFLVAAGSFLAGIVITVLGALYPAREAAKMMPVVALRAEL